MSQLGNPSIQPDAHCDNESLSPVTATTSVVILIQDTWILRIIVALVVLGHWSHSVLFCDQFGHWARGNPMKSIHLRLVDHVVMRSVAPKGRKTNNAYRAREHLTEDDIGGWSQPDQTHHSGSSPQGQRRQHPHLERDEVAGLKRLQRVQESKSAYVFVNERGQPFGRMGIGRMIERAGEGAALPFPIHAHMLRHSTGDALAAKGMDMRRLQHFLGQHHQHRTVHRNVTGALQGHLVLKLLRHRRRIVTTFCVLSRYYNLTSQTGDYSGA